MAGRYQMVAGCEMNRGTGFHPSLVTSERRHRKPNYSFVCLFQSYLFYIYASLLINFFCFIPGAFKKIYYYHENN